VNVLSEVLPLALLDAISVSTLLIPIWFLLTPRGLRYANVYLYLLLVAIGYLVLGVVLMTGLSTAREQIKSALESPAGDIALAAVGVVCILFALWYGLIKRDGGGDGRLNRWRETAVGESATMRGVFTVAAIAVMLEIATMFPYLLAIDTLDRDGSPWVTRVVVLAVYCLVMVAPAGLLTAGRMLFGAALTPALRRVNDWIRRNERQDTAWILGIVGFLLVSSTGVFEDLMRLLDKW
jgi:hypothetical protein